ncbi:hypothetical protein C8F04DRAFT_472470 [Mycena alexandri]|uniref:Uncharacterized protein n=1 Tax=Mycena alexandri TaxID=1745969 RepID=A0AAD6SZV5_9AGAR|nr:hypothetical protein C8F04DRAFT_472470 [Mycena alexandri]
MIRACCLVCLLLSSCVFISARRNHSRASTSRNSPSSLSPPCEFWEFGNAAEALLELYTPPFDKKCADAATVQLAYLVHTAPRYSSGAISLQADVIELWADFIHMAPPSSPTLPTRVTRRYSKPRRRPVAELPRQHAKDEHRFHERAGSAPLASVAYCMAVLQPMVFGDSYVVRGRYSQGARQGRTRTVGGVVIDARSEPAPLARHEAGYERVAHGQAIAVQCTPHGETT